MRYGYPPPLGVNRLKTLPFPILRMRAVIIPDNFRLKLWSFILGSVATTWSVSIVMSCAMAWMIVVTGLMKTTLVSVSIHNVCPNSLSTLKTIYTYILLTNIFLLCISRVRNFLCTSPLHFIHFWSLTSLCLEYHLFSCRCLASAPAVHLRWVPLCEPQVHRQRAGVRRSGGVRKLARRVAGSVGRNGLLYVSISVSARDSSYVLGKFELVNFMVDLWSILICIISISEQIGKNLCEGGIVKLLLKFVRREDWLV